MYHIHVTRRRGRGDSYGVCIQRLESGGGQCVVIHHVYTPKESREG